MENSWCYNEYQQVGTDYSNFFNVESYDRYMQQVRNYQEEAKIIIQHLQLNKNSGILEIGTGTGHFAIEASKHFRHIDAIDVSSEMLELSESKAKSRDIKNISWFRQGFLSMKCLKKYDGIVTKAALHHLPDFWKYIALQNVYNSLNNIGKFYLSDVIFSFQIKDYEIKMKNWIAQVTNRFKNENMGKEAEMHIRNEYSTFDWIIEKMLMDIGFRFTILNKSDYFSEYLCEKR